MSGVVASRNTRNAAMDLWGWVYYEQDARARTNARYQEVQLDRLAAMADDRHPNRGIGRRRGMSTLGALLRGDNEMNTNHTSILDGRLFRIGLFAALAVVVLVGAAYLWGTGLRAAAPQALAPAPSFNELAGVAGIRALDSAAATRPEEAARLLPAARYIGYAGVAAVRAADVSVVVRPLLAGIAAVRAADASTYDRSSLLGMAAVRAAD
jgi:hypothetical protein